MKPKVLLFLFSVTASVGQDAKPLKVFVSGMDFAGGNTAAETSVSLRKACPAITITLDRDKADFIIVRDHNGAGMGRNPHKVTVFNSAHDLVYAGATKTVAGAAKSACEVIAGKTAKK